MNKGKKVLITGVSHGMGLAIGKKIAPSCAQILGVARSGDMESENQHSIQQACMDFRYLSQNLEEGELAAKNIAKWATSQTEYLDAIILNAGFFIEGEMANFSSESWEKNLTVNFAVNHYLVQNLLPLLEGGTAPRIVIIGSTAAYEPYPIVPTYGVAKWALRGFAINLRKELAKQRIGVSFLSPGATWTNMWEGEELPRNRLLEPNDIATLVDCILNLSEQAVVEELIVRSMDGDFHE